MLRSILLAGALCVGAASVQAGELVEDLLHINTLIEQRCGERLQVLWVDEKGDNPPCQMSYSAACVEAQAAGPYSCSTVIRSVASE
ncbi:hypothetical protein [Chitinibacter tainanensis]|uniref:hypothetical protein n=1 Tax=Chitinibacter tainanensis TaxID=230667 RepID=UPI0023544E1E|nr:hypothetical protein [Chitinibacter tainanensis]